MVDWKDSVFSKLFEDRANVLRLYKILHPADSGATEDDVETITLENVLTTDLYNDLGFMVGGRLVILVEAQSTWTPNIIPRAFLYLAHTCQRLIARKEWSVYAKKEDSTPEARDIRCLHGERGRGGGNALVCGGVSGRG